jgi:hypothetical protein
LAAAERPVFGGLTVLLVHGSALSIAGLVSQETGGPVRFPGKI